MQSDVIRRRPTRRKLISNSASILTSIYKDSSTNVIATASNKEKLLWLWAIICSLQMSNIVFEFITVKIEEPSQLLKSHITFNITSSHPLVEENKYYLIVVNLRCQKTCFCRFGWPKTACYRCSPTHPHFQQK